MYLETTSNFQATGYLAQDSRCIAGLKRPTNQKNIPIHKLYEDGGSAIYQQIEQLADYYPYETERQLLIQHAQDLVAAIPSGAVLIELGCGDCTKTRILLSALAERDGRVDLAGIDSSAECLECVRAEFEGNRDVRFTAIHNNFFDGLAQASRLFQGRDLCVLLLGSTLGNMSFSDSCLFLRNMIEVAGAGGAAVRILLGLDLWKDEGVLRRAYDNEVTEAFELGGLRNTLRSIDSQHVFDMRRWRYEVVVNPLANQVEMYAVATDALTVHDISFEPNERILLEVSHKFRPTELKRLFEGCHVLQSVGDNYCVVVLAPEAPPETNPWMRYGEEDLYDIDRVASLDYAAFARAYDWAAPKGELISLLDVGCGSGAFPSLLRNTSAAGRRFAAHVGDYDLLDISANSLRIAADRIPFRVGRRYLSSIQDFGNSEQFEEAAAVGYDMVWSVHGITAVRRADLWQVLLNMLSTVKIGGQMVIVMSDAESHYARIDRAWHADRIASGKPAREQFLVAEEVVAMLRDHGISCDVVDIVTDYLFPADEVESWRKFNAWCVYDHDFDIMNSGQETQAYVRSCRDTRHGGFRLRLSSKAMTVHRDALSTLRLLAKGKKMALLYSEKYAQSCIAYESHSNQRAEIIRHLAQSQSIAEIAQKRAGRPLRVLSVGCGDGQLDLAMLKAALPAGCTSTVVYIGVDENPAQRVRWAEVLEAAGGWIGDARLEASVLSAEQFAQLPADECFDCVFLVHVLYYVDDVRATLRTALDRVAPGGKLMIWHAPEEEINQLSGIFWAPQFQRPIPFDRDVADCLTRWGLVTETLRIDARLQVDVADAKKREQILSFLIQSDTTRLSYDIRRELDATVARLQRADGTLSHPVTCFMIGPR